MSSTVFFGASALAIITVIACLINAAVREPAAVLLTVATLATVKPLGYLLERWPPTE